MMQENELLEYQKSVEKSIVKKYRKDIWCKFTKAINDYDFIQDGDRIAIGVSGGKESLLMAKLFQEIIKHRQKDFELRFVSLVDSDEQKSYIEKVTKKLGIPVQIIEKINTDIDAQLCDFAKKEECNKVAIADDFDDVIETILMGMLYDARIKTIMPKEKKNSVETIRPMYLIRNDYIVQWMYYNELQLIDNELANDNQLRTREIIKDLRKRSPYIEKNIFKSVENVSLSTIIAYKKSGENHHFLDEY